MPNQALYLKYRPRVFEDMIGQEHITHSLQNALAQNRIRHAYLFSGPRGTGKTTLARILAKAVNCTYPDVTMRPCDQCPSCQAIGEGRYLDLIEIDAASNNGVDDVRELRDKIGFAPNEGRYKVYVIDEVHRFSAAAFDALLKTLEEPPEHALFILATTELDKVPATIKSRCLKYELRRVPVQTVAQRLEQIAEHEGIAIDYDALELVARQGTGSVRDSISLLDQLLADPTAHVTRADAEQILGTAGYRAVGDLAQALLDQQAGQALEILEHAIEEGVDPRQFGGQLIDYLRNVLLAQVGGVDLLDVSAEQRAVFQTQAAQADRGQVLRAIRAFNTALSEMRGGWQPQIPLELALVEATRSAPHSEPPMEARPASPARRNTSPTPASAEPPKEEEPPLNPGVVSLEDLRKRWPEVLAMLKQKDQMPTAKLLEYATLHAVDGDQVILAMQAPPLMDQLRDPKKDKALREALGRVMRVALRVKLIQAKATADMPMSDTLTKFVQSVAVESIQADDSPK